MLEKKIVIINWTSWLFLCFQDVGHYYIEQVQQTVKSTVDTIYKHFPTLQGSHYMQKILNIHIKKTMRKFLKILKSETQVIW